MVIIGKLYAVFNLILKTLCKHIIIFYFNKTIGGKTCCRILLTLHFNQIEIRTGPTTCMRVFQYNVLYVILI